MTASTKRWQLSGKVHMNKTSSSSKNWTQWSNMHESYNQRNSRWIWVCKVSSSLARKQHGKTSKVLYNLAAVVHRVEPSTNSGVFRTAGTRWCTEVHQVCSRLSRRIATPNSIIQLSATYRTGTATTPITKRVSTCKVIFLTWQGRAALRANVYRSRSFNSSDTTFTPNATQIHNPHSPSLSRWAAHLLALESNRGLCQLHRRNRKLWLRSSRQTIHFTVSPMSQMRQVTRRRMTLDNCRRSLKSSRSTSELKAIWIIRRRERHRSSDSIEMLKNGNLEKGCRLVQLVPLRSQLRAHRLLFRSSSSMLRWWQTCGHTTSVNSRTSHVYRTCQRERYSIVLSYRLQALEYDKLYLFIN